MAEEFAEPVIANRMPVEKPMHAKKTFPKVPRTVESPRQQSKLLRNCSHESLQRLFAQLIAIENMKPWQKHMAEFILLEH